jgi:putative DNA methylase
MTGPKNDQGETTWGGLANEVRYWGEWVLKKVKAEIGDLYPLIPDPEAPPRSLGSDGHLPGMEPEGHLTVPGGYLTPIAYLWTRTVACKNPACGGIVPLYRQTWLSQKGSPFIALQPEIHPATRTVKFKVRTSSSRSGLTAVYP